MANTNSPFGLKPIKKLSASPYCGEVLPFLLPSSDQVDMFIGDPVDIAGSSNSSVVNGYKAGTLPTIIKATVGATNYIMGAIVDVFKPTDIDDALRKRYRVASTDTVVFVALGNDMVFEIQADEDIVAGDVGSNAAYAAGSGGSTATGYSSAQLDSSSIATDATEQLTLLRIINRTDNALGNYCKCEVFINKLRLHPFTVGV
jgi:hypothetical protein